MVRVVSLEEVRPQRFSQHIVLTEDGVRIIEPGEPFHAAVIEVLKDFAFDPVAIAEDESDAAAYIREQRYIAKPVAEMSDDDVLGFPVVDDDGEVLLEADTTTTIEEREVMLQMGITRVHLARPEDEEAELKLGRLLLKLQKLKNAHRQTRKISKNRLSGKLQTMRAKKEDEESFEGLTEIPAPRLPTARVIVNPEEEVNEAAVDAQVDAATDEELEEKPEGPSLESEMAVQDPVKVRPRAKVKAVVEVHEDVVRNAEQIFAQVRANEKVNGELIHALATSVITGLVNDKALVLNLAAIENSKYYLVKHAINTTLLSVGIASALGFSRGQIYELSYGALLHDIGTARLSADILKKTEELSSSDWIEIKRHPVIGLDALQSVTRLPRTTPLVVYQENERIDGSGYPKARSKARIHTYAKIVQVAASYDAMISRRPWRRPRLPYTAMAELLKLVSMKKYDADVVRAMIAALGLFPIGSWVRMGDGSFARVVSPSARNYTRPVVSLVIDAKGVQLKEPHPIDLSSPANADLKIAAPVKEPGSLVGDTRVIGF